MLKIVEWMKGREKSQLETRVKEVLKGKTGSRGEIPGLANQAMQNRDRHALKLLSRRAKIEIGTTSLKEGRYLIPSERDGAIQPIQPVTLALASAYNAYANMAKNGSAQMASQKKKGEYRIDLSTVSGGPDAVGRGSW